MPKDKTEVLIGVGALYAAAVGTAFPTHFATPASPWVHVGYTDGGVRMPYNMEEAEIEVDQELDPVAIIDQRRQTSVETTLAQFNAANLVLAFGGGTITPIDPDAVPLSGDEYDQYTPPAVGGTGPVALLFDGINETSRPVRLLVPEAKRIGESGIQFNKREKAIIPVQWRILVPASGDPFTYRVKTG